MDLLVVRPFGAYKRGDLISDSSVIASVLASEHAAHVVRVAKTVVADATQKGS